MIILCQLNFIFLHENFKKQEKMLALTSFYCPSQERWLGDSPKLICIGQLRFYIFLHAGGLKKKRWGNFNNRTISSMFSSIATAWFGLEAQFPQLINS